MYVEFSQDVYNQLQERAAAAGFADVASFVVALVEDMATDPRGSLSDEELRDSIAACERGESQIKAGQCHDMREALLQIGRDFGLELPR